MSLDAWERLRRLTAARIGLGAAGSSLRTAALLDFELAHAQARDAVYAGLNSERLTEQVRALGLDCLSVRSAAANREEYLRRPDLGRRLSEQSRHLLDQSARSETGGVAFVVADGLSALAVERHAIPLLALVQRELAPAIIGTVVIAEQARVAIGDSIGEILEAEIVVVLIGERPGLSSPDSLGAYLTYDPKPGRFDADRNCLSNIRPEGLSYGVAAHRLLRLLRRARELRLTGVALKDESDELLLPQPMRAELPAK